MYKVLPLPEAYFPVSRGMLTDLCWVVRTGMITIDQVSDKAYGVVGDVTGGNDSDLWEATTRRDSLCGSTIVISGLSG